MEILDIQKPESTRQKKSYLSLFKEGHITLLKINKSPLERKYCNNLRSRLRKAKVDLDGYAKWILDTYPKEIKLLNRKTGTEIEIRDRDTETIEMLFLQAEAENEAKSIEFVARPDAIPEVKEEAKKEGEETAEPTAETIETTPEGAMMGFTQTQIYYGVGTVCAVALGSYIYNKIETYRNNINHGRRTDTRNDERRSGDEGTQNERVQFGSDYPRYR